MRPTLALGQASDSVLVRLETMEAFRGIEGEVELRHHLWDLEEGFYLLNLSPGCLDQSVAIDNIRVSS